MTRKVFLFLTVAFCLCMANKTMAYDFSAVNNGKTIYYIIISSTAPRTVVVTYYNTNYNSYSGAIDIPSTVTYNSYTYSVTSIGSYAFRSCSGLTSVTIPNSVTSIGQSAFYNCSGLTSVTIPNSVTSIGQSAFHSCSGLTSVTIPNSVTSIGSYAFYNCSGLTSISVDVNNTTYYSINGVLFNKAQTILICFPAGKTGSYTIPNSVTSIGDYAFRDCSGLTSVTIPNSVTSIGSSAFYNCSGLTSVTIPNSVTTIGNSAFYYCSGLTSVTIPNSVTSIGDYAFYYCSGLTSVTIPNSVTSIGDYAFYGCSGLTSITIPNSVTSIGTSAFQYCSGLTSVTIPNSVTSIEVGAFYGCSSLTSVTIPNSVTSIGDYAFFKCSGLTSVTIPNSVTSIGKSAFYDCSGLTFVTIPNSVTFIGNNAFRYCYDLTSVTIPNSVTVIGTYAFGSCSGLTSVTNLNLVPQTISSNVFSGVPISSCTLTVPTSAVTAYQNAAIWKDFAPVSGGGVLFSAKANNAVFGNVTADISDGLYSVNTSVTISATPLSTSFLGWTSGSANLGNTNPFSFMLTQDTVIIANFGNLETINLTAAGTLKNQPNIKNITHLTITGNIDARDIQFMRDSIPLLFDLDLTGATIVAYSGIEGTRYGSNYTYPNNEMPQYSFYYSNTNTGKTILASIKMPAGLITIGTYAFENCSGLTSVTIPNSVTSIGDAAFYYCYGLTSVTIPNSVTSIGVSAFYDCSGLTSVIIPHSVTSIGNYAFRDCRGLTSVTIPNSVTSIGDYAFYDCYSLTEIYVKAVSPPSIGGSNTFHNVSKSIPVYVPCGKKTAYQSATYWSDFTNIIDDVSPLDISVQSNDAAMGSVNITQHNTCTNNTAIITATPSSGHSFIQWHDGNTQNPRTITVTQDTTFTAIFGTIISIYHVYVSANNPSMGTVSGGGDYAANSTATISATPNSGYRFVQWNDGNKQNPRTITITQDIILTAEFAVLAANTYHVTVFADDPSMGSVSGGGDYTANSTAVIEATPNAGFRFKQWHDGNTQNPRTITVTQDISFSAEFVSIKHKVSLSANDATRGTFSGHGEYTINTVVPITATPNTGYRFVGWSDGNKNSARSITITKDIALVAIFGVESMYYVYAAPNNTTMGSVTGSNDYEKKSLVDAVHKAEYSANSVAIITAIPNPGYRFVRWNDGSTTNPLNFTVTDDHIITAIFDESTGITDREASDISVYPNPARDNITVVLPENIHQAVFTLYDIQGKVLLQQEINNQENVSVSNLAKGVYIYHVTTDKEKHVGKLIIKNFNN